jgi:hypothetical protein
MPPQVLDNYMMSCPDCGEEGWPFLDQLLEKEKVLSVPLHRQSIEPLLRRRCCQCEFLLICY